jgi:predicted nucleotidyltransferase
MNEIDLDKIQEHLDLLNILKASMGYILPDMLEEMVEAFGEEYNIILKLFSGDRKSMSLGDFNLLETTDIDLYDDIKEIFIPSEDYNYIFTSI